jgi:hypothetical protein
MSDRTYHSHETEQQHTCPVLHLEKHYALPCTYLLSLQHVPDMSDPLELPPIGKPKYFGSEDPGPVSGPLLFDKLIADCPDCIW